MAWEPGEDPGEEGDDKDKEKDDDLSTPRGTGGVLLPDGGAGDPMQRLLFALDPVLDASHLRHARALMEAMAESLLQVWP